MAGYSPLFRLWRCPMPRFTRPALLFLLLTGASAIFAQNSVSPTSGKPLTPEALLGRRHLSDLEFSPDGARVALVVSEPPKGDQRPLHIWLFVTSSGSFRQLTYSAKSESSPKWSPDGKSLAFLSDRGDADQQQIYLLSMSGGDAAPLTKGKRSISRFAWSHDGKQIAFLAPNAKTDAEEKKEKDKDDAKSVDRDDKRSRLWILNLADHSERALTPENFNIADLAWFPEGRAREDIATPGSMPSSFAASPSGAIAFVGESSIEPQELYYAAAGQQPKKFPSFNKSFDEFAATRPEIYKYKSVGGLEIEAALLKPSSYDGKTKLPLIALIHGGPTGAWESSIDDWGQLLVERGYAIFYPNIRGSVGYGEKFIESNRADWGGADYQDVMAGIDDLIAKGIADPNRLGIGG